MKTRADVVVIQTMKDVGMERDTLPRHVQRSMSTDGCQKVPKTLRKVVAEHKKGESTSFPTSARHTIHPC